VDSPARADSSARSIAGTRCSLRQISCCLAPWHSCSCHTGSTPLSQSRPR